MSHTPGSLGFAPDLARMESESADFTPTQAEAPHPYSNISRHVATTASTAPEIRAASMKFWDSNVLPHEVNEIVVRLAGCHSIAALV